MQVGITIEEKTVFAFSFRKAKAPVTRTNYNVSWTDKVRLAFFIYEFMRVKYALLKFDNIFL